MLNNTQAAPLGDGPNTGRTALAGVQEKIVFLRDQGCWLDDARFVDRRLRWNARTRHRALRPITRCTPRTNPSGRHDQALGASKDKEYQEYQESQESQESGGKLSLERVAELLGRNGDEESVHRLLRLLTLSQAGGNLESSCMRRSPSTTSSKRRNPGRCGHREQSLWRCWIL